MSSLIGALLRRPIAVSAFYILVAVLAVVALVRLPIALLPTLEMPALVVWTAYADVSPQRVERAVTERVEEALAGTTGLLHLTGRSQLGGSLVRADFGWNVDLDAAALEIRRKLERTSATLPREAERPLVLRVDPSARPILVIAMRPAGPAGPQDLMRLKELARDVVRRRLEQIDGVARVRLTGGYDREIEVLLETEKIAAYGLDPERVVEALDAANVTLTGGMVRQGPFRYPVEVSGELRGLADVEATIVSNPGRPPIALGEVARVRDSLRRRQGLARLDGTETLLLLVERRPDANTVATAAEVREALAGQRAELEGVRLDVVIDDSRFITAAIGGVGRAVAWGGALAILVLLVFLRRPRALLAIGAAVPMALGITLVLFDRLGISLNLISLSGLALGVGMLVDNAIVVVENIARHREQGLDARGAARRGSAEVALAITASTITTIAVFLPLSFVEGLAGKLFRDQSFAVVCSLAASLLVALTVVPLVLSREPERRRAVAPAGLGRWRRTYERSTAWCLRHPGPFWAGVTAFLGITAYLAGSLPREAVPAAEQQRVDVRLELPPGADPDLLSRRSGEIEAVVSAWPEVRRVLADLGERDEAHLELDPRPSYRGDLHLFLTENAVVDDVLARLREWPLPGDLTLAARAQEARLKSLLDRSETDLYIDLSGPSRAAATAAAATLRQTLEDEPALVHVTHRHEAGLPAYRLAIDRDALRRHGADLADLEVTLETTARGREATRLATVDEQIPVVVRRPTPETLERLLAARVAGDGGSLPIGAFVDAERTLLPAVVLRHQRLPVARLSADVAPGADLSSATRAVEEHLGTVLPAGVSGRVGGANEDFRSGARAAGQALLLSLLLVYLILVSQFESLLQPLVILAMVPLALGGGVLALSVTGQSWSLMSLSGCVVLVGIAVNDAIIKVDFIHRARRAGLSIEEAVRKAGRERIRPVMMTTLTTAAGLLPLALGLGEGAALRAPMAIVIAGGLVVATGLTLLAIPVFYTLAARLIIPSGLYNELESKLVNATSPAANSATLET